MAQEIISEAAIREGGKAALDFAFTGVMYALIVIPLILVIFYFVYRSGYNVRVRLRVLTSTYDKIIDTYGRFKKDNKGVEGLELWRYKIKRLPLPPPEALGLTDKGKYALEIEIDDSGSARYITVDKSARKYEPFDTNDQLFYLNEMRKAAQRKKVALSELILQLAPITALVIIFVMALIYWGDVMQPSIDFAKSNAGIAETQRKTVELLDGILRKEQLIRDTQELILPDESGQIQNNATGAT